jgi:putative acetyltransferase
MTAAFAPIDSSGEADLIELWVDSWSEVYADIDFGSRRAWFKDHMADWLAKGGSRIGAFEEDERLAGFILLNERDGHLDQICVRRDLKGRGIAHGLMAHAMRLSPNGLSLDVNQMNVRAIAFYERLHFVKTGEGVNPTSGLPTFHYRWRP